MIDTLILASMHEKPLLVISGTSYIPLNTVKDLCKEFDDNMLLMFTFESPNISKIRRFHRLLKHAFTYNSIEQKKGTYILKGVHRFKLPLIRSIVSVYNKTRFLQPPISYTGAYNPVIKKQLSKIGEILFSFSNEEERISKIIIGDEFNPYQGHLFFLDIKMRKAPSKKISEETILTLKTEETSFNLSDATIEKFSNMLKEAQLTSLQAVRGPIIINSKRIRIYFQKLTE